MNLLDIDGDILTHLAEILAADYQLMPYALACRAFNRSFAAAWWSTPQASKTPIRNIHTCGSATLNVMVDCIRGKVSRPSIPWAAAETGGHLSQ